MHRNRKIFLEAELQRVAAMFNQPILDALKVLPRFPFQAEGTEDGLRYAVYPLYGDPQGPQDLKHLLRGVEIHIGGAQVDYAYLVEVEYLFWGGGFWSRELKRANGFLVTEDTFQSIDGSPEALLKDITTLVQQLADKGILTRPNRGLMMHRIFGYAHPCAD